MPKRQIYPWGLASPPPTLHLERDLSIPSLVSPVCKGSICCLHLCAQQTHTDNCQLSKWQPLMSLGEQSLWLCALSCNQIAKTSCYPKNVNHSYFSFNFINIVLFKYLTLSKLSVKTLVQFMEQQ